MTQHTPARILTVFSLAMITIGSVDSIRNLPASALFSGSVVFFYLMAAIFFLIPAALMSAELATGWPSRGGVYTWVKEAFGPRWALLAVWYQWISNVIWYPTILSFMAGTIAYITVPSLASEPLFMVIVILAVFWFATGINLLGMRTSAQFSTFCTIFGLIIPMLMIIGLGIAWVASGNPSQVPFELRSFLPSFDDPTLLVALTAIILSCCGIEITSTHALEVQSPQRDYPKALLISVLVIISTLVLGSLSIAIVIPAQEISLVAGLMQAFEAFLGYFHLKAILPIFGAAIIIGVFGGLSNWIIGPSKGFLFALKELQVGRFLHYENQQHAPAGVLIFQACLCTLLSLTFFFMPSINSSYWLLTVLASQLYLVMYSLVFVAGFWLRIKKPEVFRAYRIPGGIVGIAVVSLFGVLSCVVTIMIGFYPPSGMQITNPWAYSLSILGGFLLLSCPAFIFYYSHKQQPLSEEKYSPEQA